MTLARMGSLRAGEAQVEAFALPRIVDETLAEFRHAEQLKGITLRRHVDPVTIDSYPEAVHIVLRNLVDNAMRYTPPAGDVVVDARVRDRVFERFCRLDDDTHGSGLGLYIVRSLAESLGGSARIVDSPQGAGTCVQVEWPIGSCVQTGAATNEPEANKKAGT